MGLGTVAAFAQSARRDAACRRALRYTAVLLFSMVGGLIPGTLFSLAVRLAPGERTVSTTVGLDAAMVVLRPVRRAAAGRLGRAPRRRLAMDLGRHGACSLLGLVLAGQIGR